MKEYILTISLMILSVLFIGSSCSSKSTSSGKINIREQPGIEFCPTFCNHIGSLAESDTNPDQCLIYLEDIVLENDAGKLDCVGFCQYEMENSIQLNPECMSKVSRCDQIECASLLDVGACDQIENVCK